MTKIAIIGGNAAGPSAAAKAKRVNPKAEVVLFDAGRFISTGTCELPYLISGTITDYNNIIFYTAKSFYEEKRVKVNTSSLVEKIDRKGKFLTVTNLNDNSTYNYSYDKLVLATGSTVIRHPVFNKAYPNVFYLKNVSDYLKIDEFIKKRSPKKVLVIGAGYTGIEIAEALANINIEVTLIDKDILPFPSADVDVRNIINEIITSNGIEFISGVSELKVFESENNEVKRIKINDNSREYDAVFISLGFSPNSDLAVSSQLQTGKSSGISVDNKLRTSDPNIFAAGDCIELKNRITGKNENVLLATLAHSCGHIAGANAAGDNLFIEPFIKNSAVKIFNKFFVSIGINSNEAAANGFRFRTVSAVSPNLVKVMPGSTNTFGKIIYETDTKRILGAQFIGEKEVIGYGDLISSLIFQKTSGLLLSKFNFNYTPPGSPFVNILSVLGRKIETGL